MLCPRYNQGKVNRVRIDKAREIVHICEECDALWPSSIDVTSVGFIDFSTYVAAFGLNGLWSELTELDDSEPELPSDKVR